MRLILVAMMAVPTGAASFAEGSRFPLSVTGRYLTDAAGRPFLLHGDTAWSLIADLSRDDAERYLTDRAARGFNTILVSLIEHRYATNAPANAEHEPPFLVPGDYATPNERYFAHADWVLNRARELGILVLLTPSYMGIGGGGEGWYRAMERNGAERLRAYGRYLGRRFKMLDNIVWVHGGDYDPPDRTLAAAIAEGIRAVDRRALHTAHGSPESVVSDVWADAPWLAIDTVYTYGPVGGAVHRQRDRRTGRPFVLIESAYENERGVVGSRLRAQAYQALLGGAAGQVFGNNPIWHFNAPGIHPAPTDWKQALDGPGSRDMALLGALFQTLPWWRLQPAAEDWVQADRGLAGSIIELLQAGGWNGASQHPAAAIADDRSFAIGYIAAMRSVQVGLGRLAGPLVVARWHDPTTGRSLAAGPPRQALGTATFAVPGPNGRGDDDWLLILESTADARRTTGHAGTP